MSISKKNSLRGAAILALLLGAAPAMASDRCKVTDPTGTPLNVRDIHKNITGTIRNGRVVQVLRDGEDDAGKPWAYIATPDGRPIGWVYREFISCY
jgi:hypothetical protein